MSMTDLQGAFDLIQEYSSSGFFAGPKPEELVVRAEEALGVSFPPMYRAFLGRFGCGSIAGFEIYGISSDEFQRSAIPNGIWLTLDERKRTGLPHLLILIAETGEGGYYAIDTGRKTSDGDSPVVEWDPGEQQPLPDLPVIAEDFGAFLRAQISAALG